MEREPQLTRSVDDPEATFSLVVRLRRIVAVPGRLLAAMFFPDRGMPRAVFGERSAAAVLTVMLCAGLSAWAIGSRIDLTRKVLQEETMRLQTAGPDTEPRSDREIEEEITKQQAMTRVKLGLGAGVLTPFGIGLFAVLLYLAGRYIGGKPTMRRALATASHAALPLALKSLILAGLAVRQPKLSLADVEQLRSFAEVSIPLGAAHLHIGIFGLWCAVLLVFGLAAAASITRRRAFFFVLVLFVLATLLGGSAPPPKGPPHMMMGRGTP